MKVYAIQSKNGIMMNACVTVNNRMIGVPVKKVTGEILVNVIVIFNKTSKIFEYLDIKNCLCKNIILVNKFKNVKMRH